MYLCEHVNISYDVMLYYVDINLNIMSSNDVMTYF